MPKPLIALLLAVTASAALTAPAGATAVDFDAASSTACSISASTPTESDNQMLGRAVVHCEGTRAVEVDASACLSAQIGGTWVQQRCAYRTWTGTARAVAVTVSAPCRALTLFRTEGTAHVRYASGRRATIREESPPALSLCFVLGATE